jgi:sugar/nucleoside kinase (ribokinase family)
MTTAGEIIVSGHLCMDLIPQMAHVPIEALSAPGQVSVVGPLVGSTGGVVSNTGLALQRLGVDVRLMASVGDDLLGQQILQALEARDPALGRLIRVLPGRASSYTVVLAPQQTDRIFLHYPGTNVDFDQGDVDFAMMAGAKLFHLGYPSVLPRLMERNGEALAEIFAQAKATGVVTSLDTAFPDPSSASGQADWLAILRRTLPHVDVFVPSIEETVFMLRRAEYDAWQGAVLAHLTADYLDDLAAELLDMGAVITGFKLSKLGFYLRGGPVEGFARLARLPIDGEAWAGARVYAPCFQVQVVGTTGAGDAAYAGLLAALVRGLGPQDAARWAAAVGACNVEAADATSGIRTWAETEARLAAGWPLSALRVPGF